MAAPVTVETAAELAPVETAAELDGADEPVVDWPRDGPGTGFSETLEAAEVGTVVGVVAEATLLETEVALEVEAALELELEELPEQDRSKRGVVLKVLPTRPKLGLGVVG